MILARRGNGTYGHHNYTYSVYLSTGWTPTGKTRVPVAEVSLGSFKKMTGMNLKPGQIAKLQFDIKEEPKPVLSLDAILKIKKSRKKRKCGYCGMYG